MKTGLIIVLSLLGGALLAEKSGYPVLPIAHNAGVYWSRRSLRKYPGTVRVVIGPPIASVGRSAREILEQTETWIESEVARMPARLPAEGKRHPPQPARRATAPRAGRRPTSPRPSGP